MMARKGLEQIIMQKQGGVSVVSLLNKRMLDASNIQALYDELLSLVTEKGIRKMVINLHGVNYLSSAVLGKLISLVKTLKREKGALGLCDIHPNVAEIFKVTQLDKVIPIYKNVQEAVKEMKLGAPAGAKRRGWLPW